jgi:hypothetical protein
MIVDTEHKGDDSDIDSEDDMVLHASISGSLKKKPVSQEMTHEDVIENDRTA